MRLVVTKMNLGLWAAAYIKEKINAFAPMPKKPFVLGLSANRLNTDFPEDETVLIPAVQRGKSPAVCGTHFPVSSRSRSLPVP